MRERKSNRKTEYDYTTDGWYFITTVTKDRENWFGQIQDGRVVLNEYGEIVKQCWFDLPNHYPNCVLDEMVIMPNHLHGIIQINNSVGTGFKPVPTELKPVPTEIKPVPTEFNRDKTRHGLSEFIRALKTFSSRRINEISKIQFNWHRSFHDRIIRNINEYNSIKNYIINNPTNWETDENN